MKLHSRIQHVPVWAGLALVPVLSYALNTFAFPAIPGFEKLPELGFVPYLTTAAFVAGVWFAMKGKDDQAISCAGLCTAFGFLGTALGFTTYLEVFQINASDYAGLVLAFLTTAHGLVCMILIEFLLLWGWARKSAQDEETVLK